MTNILLAANASFSTDMTPAQADVHLRFIADRFGYLFNPMQSRQMGRVTRSVFKLLVGRSAFKLVWHNDTLITVTLSTFVYGDGCGYGPETTVYPTQ